MQKTAIAGIAINVACLLALLLAIGSLTDWLSSIFDAVRSLVLWWLPT